MKGIKITDIFEFSVKIKKGLLSISRQRLHTRRKGAEVNPLRLHFQLERGNFKQHIFSVAVFSALSRNPGRKEEKPPPRRGRSRRSQKPEA